MGSSPVTATIPAPDERLRAALEGCFAATAPVDRGDLLLVAFSGGPDSTALLLAVAALAPGLGCRLLAAHVDHQIDPGSTARAAAAVALASELGVASRVLAPGLASWRADHGETAAGRPGSVAPPSVAGPARDGREAAARRLRYALLAALRRELDARWVLLAHHADDQVETLLLRLAMGTGLAGLAAMPARRGAFVRPLLALSRAELAAAAAASGLAPLADPTNLDLTVPRNRLRHLWLPRAGPGVRQAALQLAAAAAGARRTMTLRVAGLAPVGRDRRGVSLPLPALRRLPAELVPWALAALHRAGGLPYPPRRRAIAELRRQLAAGARVACDVAAGWRWCADGDLLRLLPPRPPTPPPAAFAYTLAIPGGVEIREADTTFRLTRQPVAPWMRLAAPDRAALDLPVGPGTRVTVRSRRPGDRLQPLGSAHRRRLKELLIDRRVPRRDRDRLPLLCLGDQVAWVPGVTLHHPFRLRPESSWAWVAELTARLEGAP